MSIKKIQIDSKRKDKEEDMDFQWEHHKNQNASILGRQIKCKKEQI